MPLATLRRMFRHEAASGVVLMLASALALVLANSPLAGFYDLLLSVHASVRIGDFGIDKPLLLWTNDGLMALFFLLVGPEIKRELLEGELSDRSRATLPAAAAIGGMIVPALIYLGISSRTPGAASGSRIASAGGSIRLGDPLVHRHRIFPRRHGIVRQPRACLAQALSDRARDHRRSGRDRRYRHLLYGGYLLGLDR